MKKSGFLFLFVLGFCYELLAQGTVYSNKGVTVSWTYALISGSNTPCSDLDSYQIIFKAVNTNNRHIRFRITDVSFYDHSCNETKNGFSLIRSPKNAWIGVVWSNGGAAKSLTAARPYDVPANDESTSNGNVITVKRGQKPELAQVVFQGFDFVDDDAPEAPSTTTTTRVSPQWSDWKGFSSCATGLEYRTLKDQGYALNYQVHLYFQVRSSYNSPVRFEFNLLDKNGKVHFGNTHDIAAGGTVEFNHKMDADKIKSIQVKNAVYINSGRSVCDANANTQQAATSQSSPAITKQQQEQMKAADAHNNYINAKMRETEAEEKRQLQQQEALRKQQEEERKRYEAEQERIRKEKEARYARYSAAIENGDNALKSGNYENAMTYYNQAKSLAQDPDQARIANERYTQAFEAKKTAERKVRVEKQQKKDKEENAQFAGMAAGTAGLMATMKDRYIERFFAAKVQLGLGIENLPMYTNNTSAYVMNKTYIQKFAMPTFHVGLKATLFNNKGVSWHINPLFNLAFPALSPGKSGAYSDYGGTSSLMIGLKHDSKWKLFAEGGWLHKDGSFTYDADAANGGTTATDDVRKGTLKYDVLKYGGGIAFYSLLDDAETVIRPAVYFERPSFFAADQKPVMSFNLFMNIFSAFMLDISYSPDYFIGGQVNFPGTVTPEKTSYFSIKVIRQGRLY
ncbi:cell envelope integrity protein TolA [Emticicia sp. TH156]|uniref:cell envelope integrity protein TolA n=1 Tax=Emticicia sp. TH156 TaxID=2067454 RepID=UPI000C780F42|nr:cell envelope integrity protein TolA [Emticicia sp. TH156]PLK44484.1 hypothetical protein C0V77_11925 [Emticicia sp. TH156]